MHLLQDVKVLCCSARGGRRPLWRWAASGLRRWAASGPRRGRGDVRRCVAVLYGAGGAAVGGVLCGGRRRPLRLGGAVLDEEAAVLDEEPSVLGEEAASSVCSSVLDEEAGERRR